MVLSGLAAAQQRAGLDVSIVATWTSDPCPDVVAQYESNGIRVTHIGPATNPMSRHPHTAKLLEQLIEQVDVVHVHAVWEQIQDLACRKAWHRGTPYVVTPHGMLDTWNMANGYWKKRLYLHLKLKADLKRAASLHFATARERDEVARLGLGGRSIVEPFGLDVSQFADLPAPGTFRAKFPQVGDRRIILFLGRLDYGKGLELLIPAFAQATAGADAALVIVGPDSHSGYRRTVEQMIDQAGIRDRTVLTGMLTGPDKLAALVDAYVLAHPSFHENFGIVVPEALACGCPAIVSDQVYLHPRVTDAGVGAVVETTIDSVASELRRWLADPALRADKAARARAFALAEFDWTDIGQRWVDHYRSLGT